MTYHLSKSQTQIVFVKLQERRRATAAHYTYCAYVVQGPSKVSKLLKQQWYHRM
jgi:hypothetical protein